MWRFLGLVLLVAACTVAVLWYLNLLPLSPEANARTKKNGDNAPLGAAFEGQGELAGNATAQPAAPIEAAAPRRDAITISDMALGLVNETEIASQIDGKIDKLFVALGQRVKGGQDLIQLDTLLASQAVKLLDLEHKSYKEKIISKELLHRTYKGIVEADLIAREGVAREQKEINRARMLQALSDANLAKEEQVIAEGKLEEKKLALDLHTIRSNREGIVVKIYNNRKPGEVVKAGEPLIRVMNDDRLRAEGAVEAHQAPLIKVGMKARVEPEISLSAYKELRRHTGAITGLAATPNGRYLASASKDHSVIVWDLATARAAVVLLHADEVHSIAAGPIQRDAQNQLVYSFLAGCDHGHVVLWRLSVDANGKVATGSTELKDGHRDRQPVRAAAFCRDGRYAVTGGDDYQICVWDVFEGKLLYRVQERSGDTERAHRGAITTLHLLREGESLLLLSAGTDKLMKKWKLGQNDAKLLGIQKDRSGDVTRLGLTADGKRCLFDSGDELRILDLADWSPVSSLQTRRQGRFTQLAVFSPAGQHVLAVSSGRLQLWAAPGPKDSLETFRPYELRQLAVPDAAHVTCGAFFAPGELPGAQPGMPGFCFTGGEDKVVRLWELPPTIEREQPLEATITFVGPQLERGAGLVQVRAELDNPQDESRRLKAGARVSLTLYPEAAKR
jgi:WD40 repeat protein